MLDRSNCPLQMISPLLPFSGGLRNQAPYILRAINHYVVKNQYEKIFCDPFFGGGSISYEARQLGYKVYASDIAKRSYIPAECLLKGTQPISVEELYFFQESLKQVAVGFKYQERVKKVLYQQSITLFRQLWLHAKTANMRYLVLRSLFDLVPIGGFGLMKKTEKSKSALAAWKTCLSRANSIPTTLDKMRKIINNGLENTNDLTKGLVFQLDARKHITDCARKGVSVVHLDPPTYGTKGYINLYWWLDALIEDVVIEEADVFTRDQALAFVDSCVLCADDIPIVVITQQETSYPLKEAVSVLKRYHRETFAYEVPIANTSNPFYIVLGLKIG